jgi:hypothetical protein
MNNPKQMLNPAASHRSSRLWPKIAGVFTIAFATVLILFIALDLFAALAERSAATETGNAQATPVVVDQNLASELTKVLVLDENQDLSDVKDPFTDRGGLSATVVSSGGSTGSQSSSSTGGSQSGGSSGQGSGSRTQSSASTTASNGSTNGPAASPVESTRQRYTEWLDRFGMSGAPLDPRLFAIEDLLPVGIVDGGNGNQEVMFYSEALGKTISFPPGTLFYDGWLTELRPEGVVFSFNDYGRTVRLRSWARSLKNVG